MENKKLFTDIYIKLLEDMYKEIEKQENTSNALDFLQEIVNYFRNNYRIK